MTEKSHLGAEFFDFQYLSAHQCSTRAVGNGSPVFFVKLSFDQYREKVLPCI